MSVLIEHPGTRDALMRQMHRLRILIVDDLALWRAKTHSLLKPKPNWQVVGEACNGLQAVQRTAELSPDLVLLDIGMPILNGIEAAKQIHSAFPSTKIVFLTQDHDADVRKAALENGADQYVLKANAASELLPAIENVCGSTAALITPPTQPESLPF
ncbi:MAG TPA: response regulator transcription factor [Terriglobales bacterium]|nr:response regulator transcription factor [Terriglobales bacterium]